MSFQRDIKLEEFLKHDKAKIRKVYMFRRCLSPKGFEQYVARYYEVVHGIPAVVRWGYGDGGIDVDATYWKNGEKTGILVQCKRWSWIKTEHDNWYVEKPDVAEFYGNVSDIRHDSRHPIRLVYATTAYFTSQAQSFCQSKSIEMVNYFELLRMEREFRLERFVEERARLKTGFWESFNAFWIKKYLPAYAEIEEEISEMRVEVRAALEELHEEIIEAEVIEQPVPIMSATANPNTEADDEKPAPYWKSIKDIATWVAYIALGFTVLFLAWYAALSPSSDSKTVFPEWPTDVQPFAPSISPVSSPSITPIVRPVRKNVPSVKKKNVPKSYSGTVR